MEEQQERIVMTPKKKTSNSTTLSMERKAAVLSAGKGVHVAGGEHRGIVINKGGGEEGEVSSTPHLCLEFRVFLVNSATGRHAQEKRVLSYWFKETVCENRRAKLAQQFFKELVSPTQFPRDYVGFIKKIMKLMQGSYPEMSKIEVELTQEMELDSLPDRPTKAGALLFTVGLGRPKVSTEPSAGAVATEEKVLEMIEASYPNPLSLDNMCRHFESDEATIRGVLSELQLKKKIRTMENNLNNFTRLERDQDNITIVKQMPKVEKAKQPSIAIICSQYHEKTAMDSLMTNRQTFVRYATNGETQAYTLGDLGHHRVVVTKLPRTGSTEEASIASGSTTTRLLGTFQEVEYVLLVGVGGGVPHYTDYSRHVRLGDVVISAPLQQGQRFIYQQCESAQVSSEGMVEFNTKSWCPPELTLQLLAEELCTQTGLGADSKWEQLYRKGLNELGADWTRPSQDTDKLFMSIGGQDLIEVGHPSPGEGAEDPRQEGLAVLHLGPVGAGKQVATDDQLRQEFAYKNGILAFDTELGSVVESVYGNRKDNYIIIRAIADYKDGTRRKEWQQYSSLMAASVATAIVEMIPPLQ